MPWNIHRRHSTWSPLDHEPLTNLVVVVVVVVVVAVVVVIVAWVVVRLVTVVVAFVVVTIVVVVVVVVFVVVVVVSPADRPPTMKHWPRHPPPITLLPPVYTRTAATMLLSPLGLEFCYPLGSYWRPENNSKNFTFATYIRTSSFDTFNVKTNRRTKIQSNSTPRRH